MLSRRQRPYQLASSRLCDGQKETLLNTGYSIFFFASLLDLSWSAKTSSQQLARMKIAGVEEEGEVP